jgi:hypothetical protein
MIGKLALIMGMITTQRQQSKAFGEEFIIAAHVQNPDHAL